MILDHLNPSYYCCINFGLCSLTCRQEAFFFLDCWGAYSCWIHYFYSVHFIQIVPNLCRLKALWIEREKMHYRTMWACQIKAWSEREEGRRDAQCFTRGTPATWAYTRITKGWLRVFRASLNSKLCQKGMMIFKCTEDCAYMKTRLEASFTGGDQTSEGLRS